MAKPPINSVMFTYNGDEDAFMRFLKTVVHDYINSTVIPATGDDNG